MRTEYFAVFDKSGFVRTAKRFPTLSRSEIAVQMKVEIPDSAFRSSCFGVSVEVPEDRVIQPNVSVDAVEQNVNTEQDANTNG